MSEKSEAQQNQQRSDRGYLIEPYLDLGNLLLVDREENEFSSNSKHNEASELTTGTAASSGKDTIAGATAPAEHLLLALAQRNAQHLFRRVWNELPRKLVQDATCAQLPPCEYVLPREKPIPKPRPPTRWERFAKAKGIMKMNKSKKVWDDQAKDWKPRYGYRRAGDETKDWLIEIPDQKDPFKDYFEERREAKRERINKNELQRLKNIKAAGGGRKNNPNLVPVGIRPPTDQSKEELKTLVHNVKQSTASLGKFERSLKGEKAPKNLGKRRKFEPNEGNLSKERERQLKILDELSAKKPRLLESRFNAVDERIRRQSTAAEIGRDDSEGEDDSGTGSSKKGKKGTQMKSGSGGDSGAGGRRSKAGHLQRGRAQVHRQQQFNKLARHKRAQKTDHHRQKGAHGRVAGGKFGGRSRKSGPGRGPSSRGGGPKGNNKRAGSGGKNKGPMMTGANRTKLGTGTRKN